MRAVDSVRGDRKRTFSQIRIGLSVGYFEDPTLVPVRSRLRRYASRLGSALRRRVRSWRGSDDRDYRKALAARRTRYHLPPASGLFSLLTTVYPGTPPDCFRETLESVCDQSHADFEWIILGHGNLPAELIELLDQAETDARIRVIRSEKNLGIIGGMRVCLEAASGDYVLPVDSDDLISPDALQLVQHAIERHQRPDFLFTDEALLIDGRVSAPFRRSPWDPVLSADCSTIWHLCAFRRERAIDLDVYGDPSCEYCHDWDTVTRFSRAGYRPIHIPDIAYLWRQHPASHTNRRNLERQISAPQEGREPRTGDTGESVQRVSPVLASQWSLLERERLRMKHPDLYEVSRFPISRGTTEYHLARKRITPATMTYVHLMPPGGPKRTVARDLIQLLSSTRYPFDSVLLVGATTETGNLALDVARILDGLSGEFDLPRTVADRDRPRLHQLTTGSDFAGFMKFDFSTEYVVVCSAGYLPEGDHWPWETLKLFERFPDVPVIAGRLVDSDGMVESGGAAFSSEGEIVVPGRGLACDDPGEYGLALKPCSVDLVDDRFWIGRASFFRKLWSDHLPRPTGPMQSHLWPIASEHHIVSAILREMAGPSAIRFAASPLISARWRH